MLITYNYGVTNCLALIRLAMGDNKKKPKCQFWDKCYRKEAKHKRDFRHPGEDDDGDDSGQSINHSINQSFNQSLNQSFNQSFNLIYSQMLETFQSSPIFKERKLSSLAMWNQRNESDLRMRRNATDVSRLGSFHTKQTLLSWRMARQQNVQMPVAWVGWKFNTTLHMLRVLFI